METQEFTKKIASISRCVEEGTQMLYEVGGERHDDGTISKIVPVGVAGLSGHAQWFDVYIGGDDEPLLSVNAAFVEEVEFFTPNQKP